MYTQMKKNILIPAVTIIALSVITGALIAMRMYYNQHHYIVTYAPAAFEESSEALSNPYQGWYHMYGYILSDSLPVAPETVQSNIASSKADGHQLALLEINLYNYPQSELSSGALEQLEMIISSWEKSSIHMIVRFLYDWSGNAHLSEPKTEGLILRHMDQAAEIINRHAPGIYILQGIFIGNYGEMHGSDHLTGSSIRDFTEHLAEITDPSIYLAVRTPQHWRTVTQSFDPLTAETAWNSSAPARLGLFNDGMLGSDTDLNTYGSTKDNVLPAAKAAADYSVKGSRAEELDFQDLLCAFVPNGGETVISNSYNDFNTAVTTLKKMHVSYLNSDYDTEVLEKWKLSVYRGDDCYDGMNGLDYMGRHLGYRYTVTGSSIAYGSDKKEPPAIQLTIANNGFSACYRPMTAEIILLNAETKEYWSILPQTDPRAWAPGTSTDLTAVLDADTYAAGSYTVYFRLTDQTTGRLIQLANTIPIDKTFGYPVASLQIGK